MRLLPIVVLCAVLAGCTGQDFSKNMRIASSESAAVLGTTATLDEVRTEKYEDTKKRIADCAERLIAFLDTGEVVELPVDELQAKMIEELNRTKYGPFAVGFVQTVMSYARAYVVDTQAIPEFPKILIRNTLVETLEVAESHRYEWRRPEKVSAVDVQVHTFPTE